MAIKFGSRQARKILARDKAHPNWMEDVDNYGHPAPLPEYDSKGNWIPRLGDEEEFIFDEFGELIEVVGGKARR